MLCDLIENGKFKELIDNLKQYENAILPEGETNLYTYVMNHKSGMDYPKYKEKGYFVGSGAIESANRYIMQNRMKLPGMRWNIQTAQNMLSLKTKEESGKWNCVVELLREHFYGSGG